MIGISSSEPPIGSSLSLLATKCQKWWSHIYLSVWIGLEGQLSIKLEIDNNQTYYSICEKQLHQIQETDQSAWDTVPSKINWETWVNDLWLVRHVVIRAAKWDVTVTEREKCPPRDFSTLRKGGEWFYIFTSIFVQLNAMNGTQEKELVWGTSRVIWKWAKNIEAQLAGKIVITPGEAAES